MVSSLSSLVFSVQSTECTGPIGAGRYGAVNPAFAVRESVLASAERAVYPVPRNAGDDVMGACRLLLLGPPQLQRDGRTTAFPLRKAMALAAFLGVEQRSFTREYLAALLWPDHDPGSALANLRRTLTVLREEFDDRCLVVDGDQIRLDPGAVEVDVRRFRELSSARPPNLDLGRIEEAAALYRGTFLEGFNVGGCPEYDEWQDAVRGRLQAELDGLLQVLCEVHLRAGRPAAALPVARRWLELDLLNEAAHRALMEAHAMSGRTDLAHRQYASCARLLGREGLNLDGQTRKLHEEILAHHVARKEQPARPVRVRGRRPREASVTGRWSIRRIALVTVGLLAAALAVNGGLRLRAARSDLSVTALQVLARDGEFSGLRITFAHRGPGRPMVEYAVLFSSDAAFRSARDYVAYAGTVRVPRSGFIERELGIGDFVPRAGSSDAGIPPGDYTASVVLDPEKRRADRSRSDNRLGSDERFFFRGCGGAEFLDVVITVAGSRSLDAANPLRVFVGDLTESLWPAEWTPFTVIAPGQYQFPLDDLEQRDSDGSGYGLLLVHDAGGDLEDPRFPGPGDVAGLYKEVADNLVYGPFTGGSGSPLHPGRGYLLAFAPPPLPPPDRYETDDEPGLGTLVGLTDAPVVQYHTFHPGTGGAADRDWYRIPLAAGEAFTVETFSAGSRWESDTGIDLSDSEGTYIRSGRRIALRSTYASLAYVNDTGEFQVFRLCISPYRRSSLCPDPVGEYSVAFRR